LRTTAHTRGRRLPALTALAITAVGVLAIAGCGGDDDSDTTAATPTTTNTAAQGGTASQGGGTINVSLVDYRLDPADPTVKAGQVSIKATNDGQVPHSIEVEGPNGDQELESDLSPGDSGTLTVDLSKPGTYEWYCPVGNHKEMGMEGEITVK
jgi:plastocyanin